MTGSGVCAVVVTFHPDSRVPANLIAIAAQGVSVIVVDNGSVGDELAALQESCAGAGMTLVENGKNLGIATALNIGVRRACTLGAHWVALFDQDSRVTENFFATLTAAFAASRWGGRLGILVPRYVDSRLGTPLPPNLVECGLEAAMTSGSLLRMSTFAELGFFVDELFIDGVDYEFSLRLRKAGYVIEECPEAVLLHSPGEPTRHTLLGILRYQTANYSPARRYYQERNKIWIAKRYFTRFPVFCLKLFLFSSKDFVKILVAESNKRAKARFFLRGVLDGVRERMGRLPGA